jgi:hypothetical protein
MTAERYWSLDGKTDLIWWRCRADPGHLSSAFPIPATHRP